MDNFDEVEVKEDDLEELSEKEKRRKFEDSLEDINE